MQPNLTIIDLSLTEGDDPKGDTSFGSRRVKLRQLSEVLGFRLHFVNPAKLLAKDRDSMALIAMAKAVWIIGRLPEANELEDIWAFLDTWFGPVEGPQSKFHEAPDLIYEAFDTSRFYPIAETVGVPQALTQLIPLPEPGEKPSWWWSQKVRWKLRKAKLGPQGAFVRTFMGTTKMSPYLSFVETHKALVDRCFDMIDTLKHHHRIGGIAVRDILPIAIHLTGGGYQPVNREYRVFIVDGVPRFWSADYNLAELSMSIKPAELAPAVALSESETRQILDWSHKLGAAFRSRFLVADFAVLVDGSIALVETNPGMTCGWPHEAVFLAAYGPFCCQILGLPWPDEDIHSLAQKAGILMWGHGELFHIKEVTANTWLTPSNQEGPRMNSQNQDSQDDQQPIEFGLSKEDVEAIAQNKSKIVPNKPSFQPPTHQPGAPPDRYAHGNGPYTIENAPVAKMRMDEMPVLPPLGNGPFTIENAPVSKAPLGWREGDPPIQWSPEEDPFAAENTPIAQSTHRDPPPSLDQDIIREHSQYEETEPPEVMEP